MACHSLVLPAIHFLSLFLPVGIYAGAAREISFIEAAWAQEYCNQEC